MAKVSSFEGLEEAAQVVFEAEKNANRQRSISSDQS
jgi:hypothetical protein